MKSSSWIYTNESAIKWPVHQDWFTIHNCKQGPEESWDDYYARLIKCYRDHSGMKPGQGQYNEMLKTVIMNGIKPCLRCLVVQSCIGWETGNLDALLTHIIHHNRQLQQQEEKKKDDKEKKQGKLQMVQLQYYQNKTPGDGRQGGNRGAGRGRGGGWSMRGWTQAPAAEEGGGQQRQQW